jgi:hypothetical protein
MVFLLAVPLVVIVVVIVAVIGIVSGGICAFAHRNGDWPFFLIRLRGRPHPGNGSLEVTSAHAHYDRTVEAQGNEKGKPTESIIQPNHRRLGYGRPRRFGVPPQQQSRKIVAFVAGPDYRRQENHNKLLENNAQERIPGDHPVKKDAAALLWLAAAREGFVVSAVTASCFLVLIVVVTVDRLEVVLEETLGALGKGPIFFVRPPLVQALTVNPFAPTLAPTRSDHCLGAVFLETNPAHLFIVVFNSVGSIIIRVVKFASPNPLKGGCLQLQLVLADGMVIVAIAAAAAAAAVGLERNRCGGKTLLEITHGCPVHRRTVLCCFRPLSVDSLSLCRVRCSFER